MQGRPSEIERIFDPDNTTHYGGKWVKGRGLCEQCNGGWMSDLESKLKPILEPLIFDWSSVLASTRGFVSVMAYWIHPAIFQTAAGTAATVCLDNQLDSRGAIQIGSQAARVGRMFGSAVS